VSGTRSRTYTSAGIHVSTEYATMDAKAAIANMVNMKNCQDLILVVIMELGRVGFVCLC
jgi:hypothetical protein